MVSVTLKSLFVLTFWCPSLPHGVPVTWAQSPKFSSRKVANVCLSIAIHLTIDSLLSLTSNCLLYFFNVYTVFFGPSKGSHKLVLLPSQWIVGEYILNTLPPGYGMYEMLVPNVTGVVETDFDTWDCREN